MKKLVFILFSIASVNLVKAQSAQTIIEKSIEEHGGWEKLLEMRQIKFNYISHKNWIEQSERPEGPYLVSYEEGTEIVDWSQDIIIQDYQAKHIQFKEWTAQRIIVAPEASAMQMFGREFPANKMFSEETELSKLYHPEFILQSAKENPSLTLKEEILFQSVPHFVLNFTNDDIDFQLFIKKSNYLISAVDIKTSLPYSFFFSPFEALTTRVYYSLYSFLEGEIRYPMQWDLYRFDKPWKSMTLIDFEINPTLEDSIFMISEKVTQMYSQIRNISIEEWKIKPDGEFELSPSIKGLANNWNVGWVVQNDGLLIIEAPMSKGYSSKVVDYLKKQYPEKRIKAVICTSDAFPHLGGIKYYAENQIPIYAHTLNHKTITQIVNQKDFTFHKVEQSIDLEDTITPCTVLPIHGEGGERYLAIYFPKQKVLYTSDLVFKPNKKTGKYFMPQYMTEIIDLVERNELEVEQIFGMHLPPTPYSSIVDEINRIKAIKIDATSK